MNQEGVHRNLQNYKDLQSCSENRCINLENEAIDFELPRFSKDQEISEQHWRLESVLSPQVLSVGSVPNNGNENTQAKGSLGQGDLLAYEKHYNQTFGHFDVTKNGIPVSATEKYLTRKQKMMTLQGKVFELKPDQKHTKNRDNQSDETTEEEDKFEFEAHSGIIDGKTQSHHNEPFLFKRGSEPNMPETLTSARQTDYQVGSVAEAAEHLNHKTGLPNFSSYQPGHHSQLATIGPGPLFDKYATAITPANHEPPRTQHSELSRIPTNDESLSNPKHSQPQFPPPSNSITSPPHKLHSLSATNQYQQLVLQTQQSHQQIYRGLDQDGIQTKSYKRLEKKQQSMTSDTIQHAFQALQERVTQLQTENYRFQDQNRIIESALKEQLQANSELQAKVESLTRHLEHVENNQKRDKAQSEQNLLMKIEKLQHQLDKSEQHARDVSEEFKEIQTGNDQRKQRHEKEIQQKRKENEEAQVQIKHLQLSVRDLEIKLENAKAREEMSQRASEAAERKLKERAMKDGQQEHLLSQLSEQNEQFKRDLELIGQQLVSLQQQPSRQSANLQVKRSCSEYQQKSNIKIPQKIVRSVGKSSSGLRQSSTGNISIQGAVRSKSSKSMTRKTAIMKALEQHQPQITSVLKKAKMDKKMSQKSRRSLVQSKHKMLYSSLKIDSSLERKRKKKALVKQDTEMREQNTNEKENIVNQLQQFQIDI